MVVVGSHKVAGQGKVGSLHSNYGLSDMADVVLHLNTVKDSFKYTNMQVKMPSWGEVINDIIFTTYERLIKFLSFDNEPVEIKLIESKLWSW